MYLKQGFESKNQWVYWIVIGLVLFVMSNGGDSSTDTSNAIQKFGELFVFTLLLIPFIFLLGGLFLLVKFVHRQSIQKLSTSRKRFDFGRLFFAFLLWGMFISVSILIDFVCFSQDYIWNFEAISFAMLVLLALLLIPFQIAFEEYLFRAYTMQGLAILVKNKWFPLFFSSVVFGLVHLANPEVSKYGSSFIIFYIISGFTLGIMTLMDEGLELALGYHLANNLFIALLVTSEWSAFQTPSLLKQISDKGFDYQMLTFFTLAQILILFIFSKKYRWTHWREKLLAKIK